MFIRGYGEEAVVVVSLDDGDGLGSVAERPAYRVAYVELVRDDEPTMRRLDDVLAGYRAHCAGGTSGDDSRRGGRENPIAPLALPLPAGFGSMSPGPVLGEALADISPRRVSGYDTVDLMTAAYRQSCHARAVFLRALLETGMRRAHTGDTVARLESPGEFAAEEARAALVWSRCRADSTFEFAWDIHERLPMLGEAMYAGVLDEPRARAFTQWTTGLTDDQAATIINALLPQAATLLVGELIDRIKRAAIAIDPDWAERRYRQAVKGRRVEGSRNDDGTANIAGLNLPIPRAAAACDRIDALARACKHAGDARPINHIRADLYLGMLDGTFEHLTEHDIITHVLDHPLADPADHVDGDDSDGDDGDQSTGGIGNGPDGDSDGDDGGNSSPNASSPDGDPDTDCSDEPDNGDQADPRSGTGTHEAQNRRPSPARATSGPATSGPATSGPATSGSSSPGSGGWLVRELRVEVAALLGLNEHPAEIVGWDLIPATLARELIASMHAAEWRWVICDHRGHPIDSGITRHRPRPPTSTGPPVPRDTGRRAGIVELHLRADDLPRLAAAADTSARLSGWAALIADISSQHAAGDPDAACTGQPDVDAATAVRDARRRSARAGLRRRIQIRDRCCTHPSCRAPATRTDQDHATDHAHGGPTTDANLGCCCRHDHRLRHDGGWQHSKPTPETTVWASPLGHTYTNRPPPVMPVLPRPVAGHRHDRHGAPPPAPGRAVGPTPTIEPDADRPPF